jgi:hypothetical protein
LAFLDDPSVLHDHDPVREMAHDRPIVRDENIGEAEPGPEVGENRRKRAVGRKWNMDETYIKVRGRWMYLYRAVDSAATRSNSGSASVVICRRPNASCARR